MENKSLVIMSYNVFCRDSLLFKDAQDDRAKLIPEAINKYSKSIDCVIIQEIFDESAEKILDKEMKKYNFKYKSQKIAAEVFTKCFCLTKRIIEDGGVKIYSKYPIIFDSYITFNNGIGEDKLAGKGVVYAKINKNDNIYHIFGTHLQASGGKKGLEIRYNQMKQIRIYVESFDIPEEEVVILGGDLNLNSLSKKKILKKAEKISNFKNIPLDMDTFIPEINEMQKRHLSENQKQNLLDHILIHNDHLQPSAMKTNFVELKSKKQFLIPKPKGKWKCFGLLNKLSKYSKEKYPMHSLSDHEPRVSFLIF